MASDEANLQKLTKESLIKRVQELENELARRPPAATSAPASVAPGASNGVTTPLPAADTGAQNQQPTEKKKKAKKAKKIDPSKYSTRFIALKLAYLGKNYNGFEYQNSSIPTIELELWKALVKSCLIFPEKTDEVDLIPWEYSKCGRTDRGVSAFGQVIGIRVRSNRPVPKPPKETGSSREVDGSGDTRMGDGVGEGGGEAASKAGKDMVDVDTDKPAWDPIADEIQYCRVLNKILPADIRVMAWCPDPPPGFSARFSCRERQYRYFFTQPAFPPTPSGLSDSVSTNDKRTATGKEGWLDIDAMREAAKMYEGVHDFRNVCKIDAAKQITNFTRRVFESDIVEVEDVASALPYLGRPEFQPDTGSSSGPHPKVYYFHVRGSAFLWHQIRHMVALLFLVGQRLEAPSIIKELLDVQKNPARPNYNMADEVPLVLWDCIFPRLEDLKGKDPHDADADVDMHMKDSLDWVWMGEENPTNMHGSFGLVNDLWENWREKKMDELLANRLLDCVSTRAGLSSGLGKRSRSSGSSISKPTSSQQVFEGGNSARGQGVYIPVMKKPLLASVEEVNDKWARSKGFASAEELTRTKNWRSAIKAAKAKALAGTAGEDGLADDADE